MTPNEHGWQLRS